MNAEPAQIVPVSGGLWAPTLSEDISTENSPMIRLAHVSPMLRLAYVSNARLGLNQNELDSIMHTSKLRNKLAGVTGLLLFNGVNFMQVLEGERALTLNIYDGILRDARHGSIKTIIQEKIDHLTYPAWGMKLKRFSEPSRDTDYRKMEEDIANTLIDITPTDLQKMMKVFLAAN